MGVVKELPLQKRPSLPCAPLPAPQGSQGFPLAPVGVGERFQQRFHPVQLPPLQQADGQGVDGPLPNLRVGAVPAALVEGADLLLPLLRPAAEEPLQQHGYAVGQTVVPRELPELFLRPGEGRVEALRPGRLMERVQKHPDLLVRQILLKAQQRVQIHSQRPGQHRQQRDVRIGARPLPLVHRWGGDPQLPRQLFLGQPQLPPPVPNDLVYVHGPLPFPPAMIPDLPRPRNREAFSFPADFLTNG